MAANPQNLRTGRYAYKGKPKALGMQKVDLSEAAKEISAFIRNFSVNRSLEAVETARQAKLPISSLLSEIGPKETQLQKQFGWYWEPLMHDLVFYEEMRDAVSAISGAFESFADFCMSGFTIRVSDPKENQRLQDALFNDVTNFREVVRRSIFEIASIGNSWTIPRYNKTFKDGFTVGFQPVRATAMRVLRDEHLQREGFVQLLHRPSEFLGPTPLSPTPTFYLPDEVCWGYTFTKGWYAYGAPPFASVPFVVRLKLTMERDIAEILHKHVPRIDVKYLPEQQMTQEKVDKNIDDLKSELSGMSAQQDLVHTPDVEVQYIGPNGKMVDATGTQNHVDNQLFFALPLTPDMLGASVVLNPEQVQERWRIMTMRAANVRSAVETQFYPLAKALQKGLSLSERPSFSWDSLNEQTEKTQAETQELHIANANTMRDAGIVSPDDAAKHATQNSAVQQKKAHSQKPTDYYSNQPPDKTVGDKDKGPSDKKTPKTEPRPRGKRHELFDFFETIFTSAIDQLREIGPTGIVEAIFSDGE